MKCYCYETETEFVFCAEGANEKQEEGLKDAWWKKSGDRFLKIYPIVDTVHAAWNNNAEDKEALKRLIGKAICGFLLRNLKKTILSGM